MVDIGGLIDRLAPILEKTVKAEYQLLVNAKSEAQNLSSSLKEIQALLEEAERRRLTDPRVTNWLGRLQDAMYEIDDALDNWNTESLRLWFDHNDDADASCTWRDMIGVLVYSVCSSWQKFYRRREISLSIKGLNEKVELIAKETAKYTLLPIENIEYVQEVGREISTSFSDMVWLESQQKEKESLVGKLLSPCQDFQVTTLLGMVGIGKTTLAQLAFHDPRVEQAFDLKSWIYIPYTCDNLWLAKAILQSLRMVYPEDAALQTLLELIKSCILGRRFLLVLDNLWREDVSMWKQLKACLYCNGAPGSRILVTTRNETVACLVGGMLNRVQLLQHPECRCLFEHVAFRGREDDAEKLRHYVDGIVNKCQLLPHAAITLGDYLRTKHSINVWRDVSDWKKELWEKEEVAKTLFAPLTFSYNELPLAVKRCFPYCAIFRHSEIHVEELTRVWMAQGYFSSTTSDAEIRMKGHEYFEKLAMQSFFHEVHKDKFGERFESCRLHTLLYDFAQYLTNSGTESQKLRNIYGDLPVQHHSLRSVRILMSGTQALLPEIGDSIHLRYLKFSSYIVEKVPDTICNLYNLQTLDLRSWSSLTELPEGIHRLQNLKHLLLLGTDRLEKLPQGIGKLRGLETLDEFKGGRGNKLEYLKELNQLQGGLRIVCRELKEEDDVEDAKNAKLKSKTGIVDLQLQFVGEVHVNVLGALEPNLRLKSLQILGYSATQFPDWISKYAYNIKSLQLQDCNNCTRLPALGALLYLEKLSFVGMKALERIGNEFVGRVLVTQPAFPSLRELELRDCESLEEWEEVKRKSSIFPLLETLRLTNCSKLKSLPPDILLKAKAEGGYFKLHIEGTPLLSQHIQGNEKGQAF